MCFGKVPDPAEHQAERTKGEPNYTLTKLNESTHLIIHNDKYFEFPYIYVKLYSNSPLAVVFDTGCGAHNGKEGSPTEELKDYIETNILKSAEGQRTKHDFFVICTHCHFDHIGGIQAFAKTPGTTILASGFDREFNRSSNRAANSLCEAFGMETPEYEIDVYADDGERIIHQGTDLGLQVLHTPGHTPDQLAIYDEAEKWLFTGDTCYRRVVDLPWGERQDVPIIIPLQGDWKQFIGSIQKLLDFAQDAEQKSASGQRVRLAAGHTTADAFAVDLLKEVQVFAERVAKGEVPIAAEMPGGEVAPGGSLGNDTFIFWQDEGDPMFSLIAPESFKKDFK